MADTGTPVTGMREFLSMGDAAMAVARTASSDSTYHLEKDGLKMLAPITDPGKVICVGMNYVDHCTEQGMPIPELPLLFNKFPSTICASGDNILKPPETEELDWEVELAIVMGSTARRVKKADAMSCVAGYTVAHDVSARDVQLKQNGGQWLLGKTFDTFAPIGPAIVTTDAIEDPHKLRLTCTVNGETKQDSNTDQLVFKTEDVIEYASRYFTLEAGDLILTGTPPGVGCFMKPPVFLKDGDVVTCEIESIGSITNKVVYVGDDGLPLADAGDDGAGAGAGAGGKK